MTTRSPGSLIQRLRFEQLDLQLRHVLLVFLGADAGLVGVFAGLEREADGVGIAASLGHGHLR